MRHKPAAAVSVLLNLAVFFGSRVVIGSDGTMDGFAMVAALLSFLLIWSFRLPTHIAERAVVLLL